MNVTQAWEVNFDGLVGPTHNYAGLSFGNVASATHGGEISSPRQAALQGLEKAWALTSMGLYQAVLPPQERPHIPSLRQLGFSGNSDAQVLAHAHREAPHLLAACSSASCMWVANAATISPYFDCADGKTHITPANLTAMLHRSIEVPATARILQAIFSGEDFVHHAALPPGKDFSDEGAANHTRFCQHYGDQGVALFVYGADHQHGLRPQKFPARQTLAASQAIARSHGLDLKRTVFAQQNPDAIDAGVFHNDVIAVGNRELLFLHELAFADTEKLKHELDQAMGKPLHYIEVPRQSVSLEAAVQSYLFNSQLLSLPGSDADVLVVPGECQEVESVFAYLQELERSSPLIDKVHFFNLRESMNNGGGPACLRLRVVMSESQINNTDARVILDESLYSDLKAWIEKHYREELAPDDLQDPALLEECRAALDELSQLLHIGPVYDFQ